MDLGQPDTRWYIGYILSSWLSNFGQGLSITVLGPTQPYLAQNVGVDIGDITYIWSFGFIGFTAGSFISGFLFKRYIRGDKQKLIYLNCTIGFCGCMMIILPFIHNFKLLIFVRCIQNVALGAFITADASLVVFTMGAIKSRPFTNALHALVGMGFFLGTFVVRPFLPNSFDNNDNLCLGEKKVINSTSTTDAHIVSGHWMGLEPIVWPFIFSGVWICISSMGYLILACIPYKMPRFYETEIEEQNIKRNRRKSENISKITNIFLSIMFLYYVIACGIERIFQPMAFTYGICGRLKLKPSDAVQIDSCYNGGFMSGRIVSIFVGNFLKPRTMIIISLLWCLLAASVLTGGGGINMHVLYIGSGLLGFFVSWQFGSGYSWVAQKMDITGRISPLFFLGCGIGSAIFPPLSGYIFTSTSWGPNGILYLTLVVCIAQVAIYSAAWLCSVKMRVPDIATNIDD